MSKTLMAQMFEYKVQEYLGEGLNSCVYRAIKECPSLGVRFEVALKVLKSENLVALWRNEFERLSSIRSLHCVQLLGWEIFRNSPTLVLEYVDGLTLDRVNQYGQLEERHITEILNQAFQGVQDLANAKVFHGDLNLHNIMIDKNGIVRLVDFGIIGSNGDTFATPEFAAPEILMGSSPNLSTDIMSLHLVGERLFQDQRIEMTWSAHKASVDLAARKEIAQMVEDIQVRVKLKVGLTQKLSSLCGGPKRIYRSAWSAALFFALIVPFLASGDQGPSRLNISPAKVSVRTSKWLRIGTKSNELRYAPIDLLVDTSKRVHLYYQNESLKNVISLTLRPGQHIVLNDEFFANSTLKDRGGSDDRRKTQLVERSRKRGHSR